MKPVPVPDGYELREKRATAAASSGAWLPLDALYDASVLLAKKPPVGALCVAWFVETRDGGFKLQYRLYSETPYHAIALGTIFEREIVEAGEK